MTKDLSLNDFMPSSLNIGEDAIFKSGKPLSDVEYKVDKDNVVKVLKSIFDPELPVSIYDLGLIYKIDCSERGNVQIEMSLTAPACPVAGELPKEVSEKVSALDKVGEVTVKLVWDPSWSKDMMSDDAKLLLDM